jgi:hypothetical protein
MTGPSRRENYHALATIGTKGGEVTDVPCRVYLPDRPSDRPEILLEPSIEKYELLARTFEGSLSARVENRDGSLAVEIEAPMVYLLRATRRSWGRRLSECRIEAEPTDLRITQHLTTSADDDESEDSQVFFWLSPNKMLAPDAIVSTSYDGSVDVQRVREVRIDLRPGLSVCFDKHYRQSKAENGETRRWQIDVATCSLRCRSSDAQRIKEVALPLLDDVLLLGSLATRTRTACVGWQASDGRSITSFYRGDISIPTGYALPSFDQGLVPLLHLAEFLQSAMNILRVRPSPQPVRSAIYGVVPSGARMMEEDFVRLFHALEEIVLDFRRRTGFDRIIDDSDWAELRSVLRDTIRKWKSGAISSAKRGQIYEKLEELNRVPLRRAFEAYCGNLRVHLADLWPVFGNIRNPGLYDVRNRLVHGEALGAADNDALWIASEHLRWTLERILLAEFGWPLEKSDVRPDLLRRYATAMNGVSEARARFSRTA